MRRCCTMMGAVQMTQTRVDICVDRVILLVSASLSLASYQYLSHDDCVARMIERERESSA